MTSVAHVARLGDGRTVTLDWTTREKAPGPWMALQVDGGPVHHHVLRHDGPEGPFLRALAHPRLARILSLPRACEHPDWVALSPTDRSSRLGLQPRGRRFRVVALTTRQRSFHAFELASVQHKETTLGWLERPSSIDRQDLVDWFWNTGNERLETPAIRSADDPLLSRYLVDPVQLDRMKRTLEAMMVLAPWATEGIAWKIVVALGREDGPVSVMRLPKALLDDTRVRPFHARIDAIVARLAPRGHLPNARARMWGADSSEDRPWPRRDGLHPWALGAYHSPFDVVPVMARAVSGLSAQEIRTRRAEARRIVVAGLIEAGADDLLAILGP